MIKTLLSLVLSFSKIGLISLGGGNSMLKLIEYEAVNYRHWVGKEEFINMLGSSFLFPGLTALKLSALIGYKTAGITGLVLAVFCINFPGLFMAFIGYKWLVSHDGPVVRKIMVSVQYGALALLAAATYSFAQGVLETHLSIPVILCSFIFFIALSFWSLSPFWGFMLFIGICFIVVR